MFSRGIIPFDYVVDIIKRSKLKFNSKKKNFRDEVKDAELKINNFI